MFKKFSKKHFFLFSSLLALFFLSIPVIQPAQAGLDTLILNLIGNLVPILAPTLSLSISAILHLFLAISWAALALVSGILEWTLSNPFTYSLTNPASNPVINAGWTLLRDLTNLGFVIGLAYIGLATALNLNNFQTKKTFGRFIVAALLINFTPVICGVIVDASNILMNFFTKEIGSNFNQFATLYGGGQTSMSVLENVLKNTFTTAGLIKILLALILNTVTAIVLFVFSFLFLARNVAIWILVIISPIAFFCWIFDGTRSTFNKWWNQFLHWSFIGVLAGFALYLSAFLLNTFKKGGLTTNTPYIPDEGQLAFVSLAPFVIVLIFMSFAFIQVMKTSASGGNMVISGAKKVGSGIAGQSKRLGLATQQRLRNYGSKIAEKGAAEGAKSSVLGTFARYAFGGGTKDEQTKWNTKGHKVARFIMGGAMGGPLIGRGLAEISEIDIAENEKYKKKFVGKSAEYKDAVLAQTVDKKKKALIIQAAQEDGTLNDMKNVPKGDKLKSFLAGVMKGNAALMAKSLRFLDPKQTVAAVKELGDRLTESQKEAAGVSFKGTDMEEYGDLEGLEGKGGLEGKLLAKMKTAKLEYMDEDAAMRYAGKDENGNIIAGLGHKFWTGAHVSKGAELFGRKFVEAFSHGIPEATRAGYYDDNPRLENWLSSSAARNLGINGPEKPEEQIKKIKETMKETTEQIKETTEQVEKLTEQIGGLSNELQKVDDEIAAMSAGGWGVTQADYDIAVAPLKAKKATLETQRTTLENTRTNFVTQKTTFETQKTDFEKQIKDTEEKAKKEKEDRETNKKNQQSKQGGGSQKQTSGAGDSGETNRNKETK